MIYGFYFGLAMILITRTESQCPPDLNDLNECDRDGANSERANCIGNDLVTQTFSGNKWCSGAHDPSLTVIDSGAPCCRDGIDDTTNGGVPCVYDQTRTCYYAEISPCGVFDKTEQVVITSPVPITGWSRYIDIHFEVEGYNNADCLNPTLSMEYEEIDNDSGGTESLTVSGVGLNEECNNPTAGCCGNCNVWGQCFTNSLLNNGASITSGNTYTVTVLAGPGVNAFCGQDLRVYARLTLKCAAAPTI